LTKNETFTLVLYERKIISIILMKKNYGYENHIVIFKNLLKI